MVRARRFRNVSSEPTVNYYKPVGVPMSQLEVVTLTVGEYEALRLVDYQQIDQISASEKIGISQPTINRILSSARKKIAEALTKGMAIKIEGGEYQITGQSEINRPSQGKGRMRKGRV